MSERERFGWTEDDLDHLIIEEPGEEKKENDEDDMDKDNEFLTKT